MGRFLKFILATSLLLFLGTPAFGGAYVCEKVQKDGKVKVLKKVKSKRKCKDKGGSWVKEDHDHDHEHDDHDHDGEHSHD